MRVVLCSLAVFPIFLLISRQRAIPFDDVHIFKRTELNFPQKQWVERWAWKMDGNEMDRLLHYRKEEHEWLFCKKQQLLQFPSLFEGIERR
jgi:hypothetical protein